MDGALNEMRLGEELELVFCGLDRGPVCLQPDVLGSEWWERRLERQAGARPPGLPRLGKSLF